MGTANSFGVIFIIRLDKLRSGKAPVYARVTVNTERVQITLKEQVDPRSWDQRKGLGKGNKAEIKSLNNFLSEIRTELGECYRELQLSKKPFTAEDVKNRFLRKEEVEKRFTDLFAYHNEKEKHKLDDNTLSHYKTTQRYLMEFVHSRHCKKDFQLSDLNLMFLTEFENFLRDYKPKGNKKAMSNSGAMTHMIRLKKMINLAISVDWMVRNPFRNFKIRIRHEERQYLTRSEMLRLEKKQFDMPRLDFVRDLFAFCCYTGLSYIDAINLKPSNLVEGIDGDTWINTHRHKTHLPVKTPLLPRAELILKKYKGDPRAIDKGTLFPALSNQKMNSYLKEIADLCRIEKNLTSHMARHTFATTVTLSNNVPIETVSKMLGHSKIATTQIYAKVAEHKISADMKALKEKIVG